MFLQSLLAKLQAIYAFNLAYSRKETSGYSQHQKKKSTINTQASAHREVTISNQINDQKYGMPLSQMLRGQTVNTFDNICAWS